MQRNSFETTLVSVFRLFVVIRLAFSALTAVAMTLFESRLQRTQPLLLWGVIETTLLLGYLSWPWLRRKMGASYLPIALIIATFGPVIENFLAVDLRLSDELTMARTMSMQWEEVILLLVPLILVSWRYTFRVVLAYCLSLGILDSALITILAATVQVRLWPLFFILGFRTLTFLLIGYIVNRLAEEQRQQNRWLAHANLELANSANTLEQLTTSRERNRLARELHDTLAHTLSAVAVQLEAVSALWEANPEQAHAMLSRSQVMTREGLNEARRAIQALRASPLEDLGLSIALTNLANTEAEMGNFELEMQLPERMPLLPPDAEHILYRIAEEALRNVVQHAHARHVSFTIVQEDHQLRMTIADDGSGFPDEPAATHNHFGLHGMRERAESIGAALTVTSQTGQGTTVQVCMEIDDGPGIDL